MVINLSICKRERLRENPIIHAIAGQNLETVPKNPVENSVRTLEVQDMGKDVRA